MIFSINAILGREILCIRFRINRAEPLCPVWEKGDSALAKIAFCFPFCKDIIFCPVGYIQRPGKNYPFSKKSKKICTVTCCSFYLLLWNLDRQISLYNFTSYHHVQNYILNIFNVKLQKEMQITCCRFVSQKRKCCNLEHGSQLHKTVC